MHGLDGCWRCLKDVKNISAKEETEKKRTWLYEENENQKWQKSFEKKKIKRQKSSFSIRPQTWSFC